MLYIQIIILALLLVVFIQDITYRSVYWIIFPLLVILFVSLRLAHQTVAEISQSSLANSGFLLIQLFFVSLYFSLKKRSWVNITHELLGWGDILFLFTAACYLSILNFLFFYIISLIGVLLFWLIWQLVVNDKNRNIPLAGMQALVLILFLITDWWFIHYNLIVDSRLLN